MFVPDSTAKVRVLRCASSNDGVEPHSCDLLARNDGLCFHGAINPTA
jgi:hypothetical protein